MNASTVEVRLVFVLVAWLGGLNAHAQTDRFSNLPAHSLSPPAVRSQGISIAEAPASAAYDPGSVIVKSKPNAKIAAGLRSLASLDQGELVLAPVGGDRSIEEALAEYRRRPDVIYAEPNYILHTTRDPNDPLYPQQWALGKIAAPAAWDLQTEASDVVVAVVDTGIDFAHPDLQDNLWTDTDGSHGYNCITRQPGGADDYGHGTHVSGIIGAVGNNSVGVAGVNWRIQLASFKFLNQFGTGLLSDAIVCFNRIAQLKQQGVNIRVTNNSWGGGGLSLSLQDAMTQAAQQGIVHVCAAANDNTNLDISPGSPASLDVPGLITVLATDSARPAILPAGCIVQRPGDRHPYYWAFGFGMPVKSRSKG